MVKLQLGMYNKLKLYDEDDCEITNSGEIEQYAYEYFHENN